MSERLITVTSKPPLGAGRINWSHPLSRRLLCYFLLNHPGGPIDLVTQEAGTFAGTTIPAWQPRRLGMGLEYAATGQRGRFSFSGLNEAASAIGTVFMYLTNWDAADTFGTVLFDSDTGNNVFFQLTDSVTDSAYVFAQVLTTVGISAMINAGPLALVFTCDGTAAGKALYVNGVSQGTASVTAPTAFSSGAKTIVVGAVASGTGWDFDGHMMLVGYADRHWSAHDAMIFAQNPYAMLAPLYIPRGVQVSGVSVPSMQFDYRRRRV